MDGVGFNLLTMNSKREIVLILNSAHGKYPIGSEPWIQKTVRAVKTLSEQQVTILCSTDPVMWNLVTMLAGKSGMEIILTVKTEDDSEGQNEFKRILEDYALDENHTSPLYLGENPGNQPKKLWIPRDIFALKTADIVYPVSIRPGGRLDSLLSGGGYSAEMRNDFRIPWSHERQKSGQAVYDFSGCAVNPFPDGEWLVHWTRASQGPWPGEKARGFYRDLLKNPDTYVRSAGETVVKIISEKMIRGTSWNIPGGTRAVSLTSLPPEDAVSLMRWRKRFVRYSFEPYGIAIKRNILVRMGAQEVHYGKPHADFPRDKIFLQSPGEKGDWIKEKEWRIRGDLRLDSFDMDDYFVIVPDETAAEKIRNRIPGGTVRFHVLFKL